MNVELDKRVKELTGQVQALTEEAEGLHTHIQELDILLKGKDH